MEEQKIGVEPIKYETLEVYEGAKFKTLHTRKHRERKPWVPDNPAMICSFIPGTIRKIYVKEGQVVKKGEKLLTLEAMKMLNELTASIAGKVKTIHVKTGAIVTKSQLLVELEAAEGKAVRKKKRRE
jgi:biotin carboxyl carrier protein